MRILTHCEALKRGFALLNAGLSREQQCELDNLIVLDISWSQELKLLPLALEKIEVQTRENPLRVMILSDIHALLHCTALADFVLNTCCSPQALLTKILTFHRQQQDIYDLHRAVRLCGSELMITPWEKRVLESVNHGLTIEQIARLKRTSEPMMCVHLHQLRSKLQQSSLEELTICVRAYINRIDDALRFSDLR